MKTIGTPSTEAHGSPTGPGMFLCYHAPCDHLFEHKRFLGFEANYLPCPRCNPSACDDLMEAAKARETDAAVAANLRRGLSPLQGTERQVQWAESIRHAKFALIEALVAECEEEYRRYAGQAVPAPVHDRWVQASQEAKVLRVRTEARFWIAKRETSAARLLGVSWPTGTAR